MNLCLGCMMKIAEDDIYCPFCGHTVGMTAENALREGTILENKYIVGKMIAENALQTTYLGWNAADEKKVIIKEFFPRSFSVRNSNGEISVSPENSEKFIYALTKFSDEYTIQQRFRGMGCLADIEAIIKSNNTLYAILEFIEGTSLEDTFREHTVTLESALALINDIAKTLTPLHKMGVTHCNISPSGIMVTPEGRVKLKSFGSAAYKLGLSRNELVGIIKTGYAPAELSGATSGGYQKADVYSLAAVLYKMLTGITPPPAMERIEKDTLLAPSSVSGVKIDRSIENAILNALEVYPDNRTESIDAFIDELYNPGTARIKSQKPDRSPAKVPLWLKIAVPLLAVMLITATIKFVPALNDKLSFDTIFVTSNEVLVPNIVNKTEAEARRILGGFLFFKPSLEFIIKDQEASETVEAGKILSQEPAKGSKLPRGGVIEVIISAGKPVAKGQMEYVVGKPEAEARKTLEALGLTVSTEEAYNNTFPAGLVIDQSIEKGSELTEKNKTVTLTISKGTEPETIKEEPKTNNTQKSNNKKKSSQQKSNSSNSTNNSKSEQTTTPPATENKLTETTPANTDKTESIKNDSVKENNTKNETPKTETPKTETPKTEAPKVETPKVETPKTETPKTETPKTETPKTETPKTETAPKYGAPTKEQVLQNP